MKFTFYFPHKNLKKEYVTLLSGLNDFFLHITIPTEREIEKDMSSSLYNIQCKISLDKEEGTFSNIIIGFKKLPKNAETCWHLGIYYEAIKIEGLQCLLEHEKYERLVLRKLNTNPNVKEILTSNSKFKDGLMGILAPELYERFKLPKFNIPSKTKCTLASTPISELKNEMISVFESELVTEVKKSVDKAFEKFKAKQNNSHAEDENITSSSYHAAIPKKFNLAIKKCEDLNSICQILYQYLKKYHYKITMFTDDNKNYFNMYLFKEFKNNKFLSAFFELHKLTAIHTAKADHIIIKLEHINNKIINLSAENSRTNQI